MIKKTFIPINQKIYIVLEGTTESPKEMWSNNLLHFQTSHLSQRKLTFLPLTKISVVLSLASMCNAVCSLMLLWLETERFCRSLITIYFRYNSVDSSTAANEKAQPHSSFSPQRILACISLKSG